MFSTVQRLVLAKFGPLLPMFKSRVETAAVTFIFFHARRSYYQAIEQVLFHRELHSLQHVSCLRWILGQLTTQCLVKIQLSFSEARVEIVESLELKMIQLGFQAAPA